MSKINGGSAPLVVLLLTTGFPAWRSKGIHIPSIYLRWLACYHAYTGSDNRTLAERSNISLAAGDVLLLCQGFEGEREFTGPNLIRKEIRCAGHRESVALPSH